MARMKKLAEWLKRDYLYAAASLLEGLGVRYHQPAACAALAASLSGHHQCHRESPLRRSHEDAPGLSLA